MTTGMYTYILYLHILIYRPRDHHGACTSHNPQSNKGSAVCSLDDWWWAQKCGQQMWTLIKESRVRQKGQDKLRKLLLLHDERCENHVALSFSHVCVLVCICACTSVWCVWVCEFRCEYVTQCEKVCTRAFGTTCMDCSASVLIYDGWHICIYIYIFTHMCKHTHILLAPGFAGASHNPTSKACGLRHCYGGQELWFAK